MLTDLAMYLVGNARSVGKHGRANGLYGLCMRFHIGINRRLLP